MSAEPAAAHPAGASRRVVVLGAGGQAREVARYLFDIGEVVDAFVVDDRFTTSEGPGVGFTIASSTSRHLEAIVAVGAPDTKRHLASLWTGAFRHALVHPRSWVAADSNLSIGVVVAPGALVSSGVTVDAHVLVNIGASISHDTRLGSFCTIGPGAVICGDVTVGEGTVIGAGATINQGVEIAAGVVVGSGTMVVSNITVPGAVVAGNPARLLRIMEGWANQL